MGVILDWRLMPDGQDKRHAYYASREWAVIREAIRSRSGGTCEYCCRLRAGQVHHQTYARLYCERLEDLLHICEACHQFISGKSKVDPRTSSLRAERRPAESTPAPASPARSTIFAEPEPEPVKSQVRPELLLRMADQVAGCRRCPGLAEGRCSTVFGEGPVDARLMLVGEAPGVVEDHTGRPFYGTTGTLLEYLVCDIIGLRRDQIYLTNVLKSRTPECRTPTVEEVVNCLPYLEQQIAIVRPEFLCLLGKTAAAAVLETALPIGLLRGKWHRYRGIPTIVTFHPAVMMRDDHSRDSASDDLAILAQAMGLGARLHESTEYRANPLSKGWALGSSP